MSPRIESFIIYYQRLSSMVGISGKLRRVMLRNRFYIKHDWDFLVAHGESCFGTGFIVNISKDCKSW